MMNSRKKLIREILKVREKSEKLPNLSRIEQKIVDGKMSVESVYHSAKLEGSKLTKEEVRSIIISDS